MEMLPTLFVVYWLSVLAWSLMTGRLCVALARRHPLLYESLGRPRPLGGAGFRGDLALLRFLVHRRDRFAGDRGLVRLCGLMRFFLCGYALFFFTLPGLVLR
jgi:hypothetical protein